MKLSDNLELVQKLEQILIDYPGLEYDKDSSARMDNMLLVKVSTDTKCDIGTAGNIAIKLSKSTGDSYVSKLSANSDGSTLDNLRSFRLVLPKSHRNVRITYPDSRNDTLMVDVVQDTKWSLDIDMNDPIWSFAKDNKLVIHFNIFAQPNYRKYLRSHVTTIIRKFDELPSSTHFSNSEFKQTIGDDTDLSKNSLD